MHFKKKIRNKVYGLYLKGVCLEIIAFNYNLDMSDVDDIGWVYEKVCLDEPSI